MSLSAWLAQLVRERTRSGWPAEVVAMAGCWPELPTAEELRAKEVQDR
jgi:hypothetical protein